MLPAGIGSKMERERRGADMQRGTPHLWALVLETLVLSCILTRPCDAVFVRVCADIKGTSVMPHALSHAQVKGACRVSMSGCQDFGMCGRTCEQMPLDILIRWGRYLSFAFARFCSCSSHVHKAAKAPVTYVLTEMDRDRICPMNSGQAGRPHVSPMR